MGRHFTKAALCLTCVCCLIFAALSGNQVSGVDRVYAAEAKTEAAASADQARTAQKDGQLVTAAQPDISMSAMDVLGNLVNEERLFYAGEFKGRFVVDVEPYLEIRETGDDSSEVLGKLYPASWGEVVEWGREWTKISSGTVTGYIPTEELSMGYDAEQLAREVGDRIVTVNVDSLYIRSEADQSSDVVSSAIQNEEFYVASTEEETSDATAAEAEEETAADPEVAENDPVPENDWVCIQYDASDESVKGYVASQYVTERIELDEAISIEEEEAAIAAAEAEKAAAEAAEAEAAAAAEAAEAEEEAYIEDSVSDGSSQESQSDSSSGGSQQTTNESPVYATSDETYLLACMVYVESGAESYEGQLAVANVIMNRVRSPLFPNTITEVIYQPGQFPGAHNGVLDGVLASGPSDSCMTAAQEALAGVNNIGDFLYFNGWVDTSSVGSYLTIGNQTFYNY